MTDKSQNQEEEIILDEEADHQGRIKKLSEKLRKCEEEKRGYLDGWQRTKAEFINARKKDEEEKRSFIKFANQDLILEIIPVMDGLETAMTNEEWKKMPEEWRKGIENSFLALEKILKQNGLEENNPNINSEFDPSFQEAVGMEPVDRPELEHKVTRVIQKGYQLNGKTIRPAKVLVGEYKK